MKYFFEIFFGYNSFQIIMFFSDILLFTMYNPSSSKSLHHMFTFGASEKLKAHFTFLHALETLGYIDMV